MDQEVPTYLVVKISGVTRLDLMGTISAAVPEARLVTAKTFAEAAMVARDIVKLSGVIVRAGVKELQNSELAGILQTAQARVVLMGTAAENHAGKSPYPVLHRPFGIDDVLCALNLPR